ncbi:MAG: ATP-grasp domain-containing protein [Clostridia bacterium]|nr:ATP-grasp domain-containing protein [Clostridia bacterium]
MKKIMLLGGSQQQVVAIEKAKALGYETVLCDYLPDNPGQLTADRFYQVSTTDKDAVLEVAVQEKIDGILAYASDPAAPTAAYVAEKLGLPGNPSRSVEILCNKDLFRKFLAENGFHTPRAFGFENTDFRAEDLDGIRWPVLVKPVDSSGSKGVALASDFDQLKEKAVQAMAFSRSGRIIVEEYVEMYGEQVAGDGLSVDGELMVACFGDDFFDASCDNPFVPVSAAFPCTLPPELQERIKKEVQRLITLLGMKTCTYNFDIRIGKDMNVYLMEIAPRSGGNYIPQIVQRITGVDMVSCAVLGAMGEPVMPEINRHPSGYYAYYALHSNTAGTLKSLKISEKDGMKILEDHTLVKPGSEVKKFVGANATMGILVLSFESNEQMQKMIHDPKTWIEMEIE